jgi:serine/threonine protein kinase
MIGEIFSAVSEQDTKRLGYKVQQQLGKKAGRRTLLAHDLQTQELVIIKLLLFDNDFEWDDLKLFEREAETLKSLSHPLIPRYLDYFDVNLPTIKGFALVQSYIPAQTLEQYLQTGRSFTEAEIKQIAKTVLEILCYLHGLHPAVIHRDIKPSNILLGERSGNSAGQVYLVDFGSVQTVLATEGSTRTVVGTYGYMPLEQFGGRTVAASDIYSLGATLIYLATGIQPADLPQKDFRIQFEQAANLSPDFTNWLRWLIEPNLERRASSALEALTALDRAEIPNDAELVISKLLGSKIQLTRNQYVLEIIIPPGEQDLMLFFISFALILGAIAAFPLPFSLKFSILVLSLPFWLIGCCSMFEFIFTLWGRIRLRVDQQQVALTYELFGFKFYRRRRSPRQNITKLVYISQHFTKNYKGETILVPAQLELWAGVQKYQLGGNNSPIKSEAEMEWLAQELSTWLGIEITTK